MKNHEPYLYATDSGWQDKARQNAKNKLPFVVYDITSGEDRNFVLYELANGDNAYPAESIKFGTGWQWVSFGWN